MPSENVDMLPTIITWSDGELVVRQSLYTSGRCPHADVAGLTVWEENCGEPAWSLLIESGGLSSNLQPRLLVVDWFASYASRDVLYVGEKGKLFIGFGHTVGTLDVISGACRVLKEPEVPRSQFFHWIRTPHCVVMVDELGLAGLSLDGKTLWTESSLEPPHNVYGEGTDIVVEAFSFQGCPNYRGRFSALRGPASNE